MHLDDIQTLYEFNYWAKHRTLGVIETISPEQYLKDMGSSHGGIHGTLVHTMGAEEVWLKRWKHEPVTGISKPEEFPTFESLVNRWEMVEMGVLGFCHMLRADADILRTCEYKDLKGNTYSQPLYQLMQHLVNHSSYHRGQVVTLLRQIGAKPVATDLVRFFGELSAKKS